MTPLLSLSRARPIIVEKQFTEAALGGAQVRSDGVLEAQLYLRHVMPYHFRKYTLVAENSVAMTTRQVQLLRASPSRTVIDSK